MRTADLVLLLVAVILGSATRGCGGSSDAAVAPDTTSGDYVSRTDFQAYVFDDKKAWKEAHLRLDYLRSEQDKIKETVKKHDDQLVRLTGGFAPSPITRLNNDPLVNQPAGGSSPAPASPPAAPAAEPVVPPGVHQVPLEPNLADYIRQRFSASEQNQQAILAKQDETRQLIQSGFQRIEGALTGLNDRVTALENARHPTPAPSPQPKVRADK